MEVQERIYPENAKEYTTILWASRHPPLEAQVRELHRKLGPIRIVQISTVFSNAQEVIMSAKGINAKYIVPVLPLSFIANLVPLAKKYGMAVLWAEMEQVGKPYTYDPSGEIDVERETVVVAKDGERTTYKVMRFVRFQRIKAVRLDLEPL